MLDDKDMFNTLDGDTKAIIDYYLGKDVNSPDTRDITNITDYTIFMDGINLKLKSKYRSVSEGQSTVRKETDPSVSDGQLTDGSDTVDPGDDRGRTSTWAVMLVNKLGVIMLIKLKNQLINLKKKLMKK